MADNSTRNRWAGSRGSSSSHSLATPSPVRLTASTRERTITSSNQDVSLRRPLTILVQGGIASGKSTVARLIAERGGTLLDCDRIAHEELESGEARAGVRAAFGERVFAADGAVDRRAVAEVVFEDPQALTHLEAILHPRVAARVRQAVAAAAVPAGERRAVVVVDAAVADKMKMIDGYDLVVFVDVDPEIRRRRALQRGWSAGELARREAQQTPLSAKRSEADVVIANDGDLEEARDHVQRFWSDHVEPQR